MIGGGQDSCLITHDVIFGSNCPTVLELCEWLKFLENPLLVPVDCVTRLLNLRISTPESPPAKLPVAVFYVRTYTLTVAQLSKVIDVLLKAKITFKNKIFAWKRTIDPLSRDVPVHLRYGGVSRTTHAWGRHVHDLRTTRGSSLMRILHVISDLYPKVVANCLVQEIPHMELPISAGDQLIDTREQLLICILKQGALNVSISGSVSSSSNLPGKKLFQSLGTEFFATAAQMTQEISPTSRLAVQRYAQESAAKNYEKTVVSTTRITDATTLAKVLTDQATSRVLKNGRAILLIVGLCPPAKSVKSPMSFWKSDCESSRILLATVQQFVEWEEVVADGQAANSAATRFLPFVNLYPQGRAEEEKTESATALLQTYLQALRPLMVLCLGHDVRMLPVLHPSQKRTGSATDEHR
jgi:hypothetical protein